MEHVRARHDRAGEAPRRPQGFTLIEVLIGITILVVGVLGVAGMFGSGYGNVGEGARLTMAVTAARQMLEDVRTVPFGNLGNLNGFDTTLPGTQPAGGPERAIARKWRYALAGEGAGWGFTAAEKGQWQNLGVGGVPFGARGQIAVTSPSATMRLITITIPRPETTRRGAVVQLAMLLSRL